MRQKPTAPGRVHRPVRQLEELRRRSRGSGCRTRPPRPRATGFTKTVPRQVDERHEGAEDEQRVHPPRPLAEPFSQPVTHAPSGARLRQSRAVTSASAFSKAPTTRSISSGVIVSGGPKQMTSRAGSRRPGRRRCRARARSRRARVKRTSFGKGSRVAWSRTSSIARRRPWPRISATCGWSASGAEPAGEDLAHLRGALDEALALDDLEHLVRRRARGRMRPVGVEHHLVAAGGDRLDHGFGAKMPRWGVAAARPFPPTSRSGTKPSWSVAKRAPVRPKPLITSSATVRMPWRRQISRDARQYSGGDVSAPAVEPPDRLDDEGRDRLGPRAPDRVLERVRAGERAARPRRGTSRSAAGSRRAPSAGRAARAPCPCAASRGRRRRAPRASCRDRRARGRSPSSAQAHRARRSAGARCGARVDRLRAAAREQAAREAGGSQLSCSRSIRRIRARRHERRDDVGLGERAHGARPPPPSVSHARDDGATCCVVDAAAIGGDEVGTLGARDGDRRRLAPRDERVAAGAGGLPWPGRVWSRSRAGASRASRSRRSSSSARARWPKE